MVGFSLEGFSDDIFPEIFGNGNFFFSVSTHSSVFSKFNLSDLPQDSSFYFIYSV